VIERALDIAITAARDAGVLARKAFDEGFIARHKGNAFDVITDVDEAAEKLIVDRITTSFPDHGVHAEEGGRHNAEAAWQWLVDPLDGTNNFAIGLPLYGVNIGLLHQGRPVLSVMHDSHNNRTIWATDDGVSSSFSSHALRPSWAATELRAANVSVIVGYNEIAVGRPLANAVTKLVKRRHGTWAPCIDWMLLVSGGMDAVVLYETERWDSIPGLHVAVEAGAAVRTFDNEPWDDWGAQSVSAVAASPLIAGELLDQLAEFWSVTLRQVGP
jgi:myo-inositol-1(or 4)-monophosphatase